MTWEVAPQIRWNIKTESEYLSQIENRLPANHPYRDKDLVTWAHEGTHGVNAWLRNNQDSEKCWEAGDHSFTCITRKYPGQTEFQEFARWGEFGKYNCMYILDDTYFEAEEPKGTLKDVAKEIPSSLRGTGYQLYLVEQQQYWNDRPLYIFDELAAYHNGFRVGRDIKKQDRARYSLQKTIEFLAYAGAVLKIAPHNKELFTFVSFMYREICRYIHEYSELRAELDDAASYVFATPIVHLIR